MESAYLKHAVGPVLAKAIAETVTAQPSNPQEYLALYLLHHLQEEQRKADEAASKRKIESQREEWEHQRALREKAAVEVIQRGFLRARTRLQRKKAEEQRLAAAYEEAEAEAEALLEEEEAAQPDGAAEGEGDADAAGGDGAEDAAGEGGADAEGPRVSLQQLSEEMSEARSAFYKAQRFFLALQKTQMGALKVALVELKERVRIAQDAAQTVRDRFAAEEEQEETNEYEGRTPALSAAAAALAQQVLRAQDHTFISVPLVLFRVLRCVCYLLLDSTPSATETPTKVAALIKPTVLVQLLRGFNPVATYDQHRPLKLEDQLPGGAEENNNEDENERNGAEEGDEVLEPAPVSQPKTRQVRRVRRVLRTCLLDSEYICELNPSDYFDEDVIAEDEALRADVSVAEADQQRANDLRERVLSQTKQRGGMVLWALLRFLDAAVRYRTARDAWMGARRDRGLEVPASHERPEEEEEDELNDEAIFDEEGEVDHAAVRQLQAKIGIDSDEALAKLWEVRDTRRKKVLLEQAAALRRAAEVAAEEEAEDEEEAEN